MGCESNFYFIKDEWNNIYRLCENAELNFVKEDYNIVMIRARQVEEAILKILINKEALNFSGIENNLFSKLNFLKKKNIIDNQIFNMFNLIRTNGNRAAHNLDKFKEKATESIENLLLICIWFQKKYGIKTEFKIEPFKLNISLKDEIKEKIVQSENKIEAQEQKIAEISQQLHQVLDIMNKEGTSKEVVIDNISNLNQINRPKPIGKIVKLGFQKIIENNLLTNDDISNLKDKYWCKRILDMNYPVIKEIKDMRDSDKSRYVNGYPRYWSKIYNISNANYYICNDWYEKNRFKIVSWINKKIDDIESYMIAESRDCSNIIIEKAVDDTDDSIKPLNRIHRWANNKEQCNHKIIRAYLKLSLLHNIVTEDTLENMCSDSINNKDTYVEKFKGNFRSMQTSSGNNHGKIFILEDNMVTLWNKISDEVMKYKDKFLY